MSITHFITVNENDEISGQHCGDFDCTFANNQYTGHRRIVIPPDAWTKEGDKLGYYTKDWKRITDVQLIQDGIMQLPDGFTIEDSLLRPMTIIERIKAGQAELPERMKIEGGDIKPMNLAELIEAGFEQIPEGMRLEGDRLISMTTPERYEAGQITREAYNNYKEQLNINELDRRIEMLQTPKMNAKAEVDEEFAAERKNKLKALLAVEQQEGWPYEVIWPE